MEDLQGNLSSSSSSSSSSSLSSSPSPNIQPLAIDEELWLMAEDRAQEILCTIQPNVISEQNRKDVIDYVQGLIRSYYRAEVCPFGSVPLKTYLPDGDIDLTMLSHETVEENLAQALCSILASKEDSEYPVKEIQHIRAQVQVVKCTVKDIAVDISFNQIAGLSTLCFLEHVDRLVRKNHLFKCSIILVKAWCYYESRILGAHHGLISTYAVEILVLYVLNLYHASVRGPLEVLYRFLDYYTTFDWENYCVSINGPVAISSLPEIVETPECEWDELLLSKEFLKNCKNTFCVPARMCEAMVPDFPIKHLNILDPLRSDNNLGRSVSRGNFHRIKFALSYGARKIREILTLPGESMGAALEKFFMNTLDRNGKGQRPDVQVPVPAFGTGRSEESVLGGEYCGGLLNGQLYHTYSMPRTVLPNSPPSPSQAGAQAQWLQKTWNPFYQRGVDVCIPSQTLYLPNASQQSDATYNVGENGRSRGTGTYIPDLNHTSYRDMHTRVTMPRGHVPVNHNEWRKSPPRKEVVETHSDIDMNCKSRSFEVSNEEFPVLPSINKTSPSDAQESVNSELARNAFSGNLSSFEISNNKFPLLSSINKTCSPTEAQESINSELAWYPSSGNLRSFDVSNEEFPVLPSIRKSPSEALESTNLTSNSDMAMNSSSGGLRSFEISEEEFPHLPSIKKASPSEAQESAQLTCKSNRARKSFSLSHLDIEFGIYKHSQSLAELPLPVDDKQADSSVAITPVLIPMLAVKKKELVE